LPRFFFFEEKKIQKKSKKIKKNNQKTKTKKRGYFLGIPSTVRNVIKNKHFVMWEIRDEFEERRVSIPVGRRSLV